MKPTFWDYVHAAFNARPNGMFVAPNWIGLGIFSVLGVLNPGFWMIGLGCELAYLGWLGTNPRFQKLVSGGRVLERPLGSPIIAVKSPTTNTTVCPRS